jgi:hypothetical protein
MMRIVCRVVADHDENGAAVPRTMTILGSSVFFVVAPSTVAELIAWYPTLYGAFIRQVHHDSLRRRNGGIIRTGNGCLARKSPSNSLFAKLATGR